MKKSLLLLILIFFTLMISSSLAQEASPPETALSISPVIPEWLERLRFVPKASPPETALPEYTGLLEWLVTLGSLSLFFIVIGGLLIIISYIALGFNPRVQRYVIVTGLLIIFVVIFGVQIVYIGPYLGKPVLTYTMCSEAMIPIQELNIIGIPDPLISVVVPMSCIFTGYVPSELTWLGLITFAIFGIILPLALLIAVFYDTTDFFEHGGVRAVVTVSLSLIAFRFLLAALFLELLAFGIAGIGLLIVNFLLFQVLLRSMTKTARAFQQVKTIEAGFARARFYELWDEMKHYESLGVSDEAKKIQKRIEDLMKDHPELRADLEKLMREYRYKIPGKS